MRKRYREIPEPEKEEPLVTYGRPSISAWIAAAAVAFAFFILGGFIKTYRQLESLRDESRQEIDELRDSVRRLQTQLMTGGQPPPARQSGYRVQPLPPARRERREWRQDSWTAESERRDAQPGQQRNSLRPDGAGRSSALSAIPDFSEYDEEVRDKPRVQFGRRLNEESRQLLGISGTPCQVVSVSSVNKRLMIEGGRDAGLAEGARLELCRDGRWIGDLRILDVFDNQSSCEVLHATMNPEPGDTVRKAQR